MYIIVVGGGKVGYSLTRELLAEGHEVLVIERDARKCERITEELGSIAMRGDGCEATTLGEAGAERADMIIAVTGDDEDNLVVCQVAKHKFNVTRTIARINNPKNERIFKELGIDITVSSTIVILEHIARELPTHSVVHLLSLRARGLEIVEVKIPEDAAVVGKRLRELTLPQDSVLALVINKNAGPQIPSGETILDADDEVVAVTRVENEGALRAALTNVP